MRASVKTEKVGLPTVTVVCEGFLIQGRTTASGLGIPNLAFAPYPGPINLHTPAEIENNVSVVADRVIKGLTTRMEREIISVEPGPADIVFKGTFEEVNQFFYEKEWSDGLPIVPPTIEKVQEFLRFVDRPADDIIGILLPEKREATVWNIAVNGVMAGCRPEYMPVLVAIVEAMAEHSFGQEHIGHTPGTEVLLIINGPIIKELDFNFEQGALRVGFQANTSIGRFWRLYCRNVAGFLPHKTDKATFGGTWRVILAENEDAVASIGWKPLSVDQGFKEGDNVITIASCTSTDSLFSVGEDNAETILNKLSARILDIQMYLFYLSTRGPSVRPIILISPCLAQAIAQSGYSKQQMKQYLFERTRFPVRRFEELWPRVGPIYSVVEKGQLPSLYAESHDPERLVPIVWSSEDFIIVVSGDPGRDNCFIGAQNGFIGYPVSKKIVVPANWKQLLHTVRS